MTAVDDLVFQLAQYRNEGGVQGTICDQNLLIAALQILQSGSIPGSGLPVASQGRLTLVSGTPVMASAVAGITRVFFTPYNGNRILLWNGSNFAGQTFAEVSQLFSDVTKSPAASVANANYDYFGWLDPPAPGGTFRCTRGPAWTNILARSAGTAIARVQGIPVNSVDIVNGPKAGFGTYLGTANTNGTITCDFIIGGSGTSGGDSSGIRLWNAYNRVKVAIKNIDIGSTWTYATPLVYRVKDNSAANGIFFLIGLSEDAVEAINTGIGTANSGGALEIGIGLDAAAISADASAVRMPTAGFATNRADSLVATYNGYPGIGLHTLFPLETGQVGGTWVGNDGASIVLSTFFVKLMY
jgi:hypothetical protein